MKRPSAAPATAVAASIAWTLLGCGGASPTTGPYQVPDASADVGAGPTRAPCGITSQCERHNEVCVADADAGTGTCVPPPTRGRCTPTGGVVREVAGCYPGAQCVPVPASRSAMGGMCSFGGAPGEVFRVPTTLKIALIEPDPFNEYQPQQALTLRWMPPPDPAVDTTSVAILLRRLPQREALSNRLRNPPSDIVWIWSSTEPGGANAGAVSLRAGRRGLLADGTLGPSFNADTLAPGRYWWFTYTLRGGVVRAASDAFTFRVGGDVTSRACQDVAQCVALIPGETSDRVACVFGRCRRRCASDLDCPGANQRCALDETLTSPTSAQRPPSGAYCAQR